MGDSVTARSPRPVVSKQAQSPAQHHRARQLAPAACADSLQLPPNTAVCTMTKQFHFGLNCPQDIVPEVLFLIQIPVLNGSSDL